MSQAYEGTAKGKKEKISKNSHDKKAKTDVSKKRKNGEKKKMVLEEGTRKYGYISSTSVVTMAEAAGFSNIQEDVAKNLAEDVTYRLRYIIQQCKKYMTHSRHKKLSCADINEVFKICDIPSVYGHSMDVPLHSFTYIKEADVYVLDDNLIDLPSYALTEIMVQQKPQLSVTGVWLRGEEGKIKTELKIKSEDSKTEPHSSDNYKQINSTSSDNSESGTKIPANLIKYYGITCNTILGHSDLKLVHQDLSKNTKILPIIPYLLNFILLTLNQLASERQIRRLLMSIEALTRNPSIDFSPYYATTRIVNVITMIIASDKKPGVVSYNLRAYASHVLSIVLAKWNLRDEQKTVVIRNMGKILKDFKLSAKVHYGALALLTALGPEALSASFWDFLQEYLTHLEGVRKALEQKACKDIGILEEIILGAAALLYRYPPFQERGNKPSPSQLDECLYDYFGEAVSTVRLNLLENPTFLSSYYGNPSEKNQDEQVIKLSRNLKYLSSRYKADTKKLTVENVFAVPKVRKKRNPRIIFKFAGSKPVPEVGLRRRRLDSRYSQFIAGKESEGHVVVVGKFRQKIQNQHRTNVMLPIGSIFSIL